MIVKKPRFTIFTPTFNRGPFLKNVYNSLLEQTYSDFEWVIVDDGSTDNTQKICHEFIEEKLINIRYYKKENGGKYTAWSFGLSKFSGKYVVCADSDDLKTPNMLEVYNYHWQLLENSIEYESFWEIKTRCKDQNNQLVGTDHGIEILDSNNNDYYYKYKYKGELSACRKLKVLLNEANFPKDFIFSDKCSHFSDGIVWSRVSRKYKTRFVNVVTRIYYTNSKDSVSTGISDKHRYNALVSCIYSLSERRDIFIKYDKKKYIKLLYQLPKLSFFLNENIKQFKHLLKKNDLIIIMLIYQIIKCFNKLKNKN